MSKLILFFTLLFCFISLEVNAQKKVGQIWHCNTTSSANSTVKKSSVSALALVLTNDTTPKIVNVFIHIVRRTDGSGGLTNDQVNSWFSHLYNDYAFHKIYIRQTGRSFLNNSTYYGALTDANFNALTTTETHSDAIDIYILAPNDTYSKAVDIPGTALAVGGSYLNTSVLSHELGHCLGLYHTHSGNGCNDYVNCSEKTDESNCSTCGDLICDTPSDPCLAGNVNEDCNYIGDTIYHPDVHNIMSYAPPTCLNRLTVGQTIRLHSTILNSSLFTNRSYKPKISGSTLVCSSADYLVNNLPSGYSINWNSSVNLNLLSSSGYSATFSALMSQQQGYIQATVVGSSGSFSVPQYLIWMGPPTISNITGPSYSQVGGSCNYSANLVDLRTNATSYNWTLFPNFNNYFSPNGNYCYIQWYTASNYALSLNATNICGTGSTYWYPVWVVSRGYFTLSPNPATDNIQVSIVKSQNTSFALDTTSVTSQLKSVDSQDVATTYTVKIYNSFGTVFYSTKKSGDTFTVPVNSLKDGTYIVEVNDGKQSYKQPLIVKH